MKHVTENRFFRCCHLLLATRLLPVAAWAQSPEAPARVIETKGRSWNEAFNRRDTTGLLLLPYSSLAENLPPGTRQGRERFKADIFNPYTKRPDVRVHWNPANIEVNPQWPFAYDTGTWVESRTGQGDTSPSTISGKYWRIWKHKVNAWKVLSLAMTPLHCTGSYCNR